MLIKINILSESMKKEAFAAYWFTNSEAGNFITFTKKQKIETKKRMLST